MPWEPSLTLALWFWNQTCTTRTVKPVSAASVSRTCPQTPESCVRAEAAFESLQALKGSLGSFYLSAGFRGNLEGGLEGSALLRGEDGARALGALVVFALLAAFAVRVAAVFILALHCNASGDWDAVTSEAAPHHPS